MIPIHYIHSLQGVLHQATMIAKMKHPAITSILSDAGYGYEADCVQALIDATNKHVALDEADFEPDPAAVFAIAKSIYDHFCHLVDAGQIDNNLSDEEIMRGAMERANQFEEWACANVDFNESDEVWVYKMEDFGKAAHKIAVGLVGLGATILSLDTDKEVWKLIAKELKLPLKTHDH